MAVPLRTRRLLVALTAVVIVAAGTTVFLRGGSNVNLRGDALDSFYFAGRPNCVVREGINHKAILPGSTTIVGGDLSLELEGAECDASAVRVQPAGTTPPLTPASTPSPDGTMQVSRFAIGQFINIQSVAAGAGTVSLEIGTMPGGGPAVYHFRRVPCTDLNTVRLTMNRGEVQQIDGLNCESVQVLEADH